MSETDSEPPVWSPASLEREHLLNNALTLLSLVFWARVLLYALNQELPRAQYGTIFLGGGVLIYVLHELIDLGEADRLERLGLWVLAGLSTFTCAYLYLNYEVLSTTRVGYALEYEYALAALFTITIIYLTYRAFGAAFVGVILLAIVYARFGEFFPGLLQHSGVGERQVVNLLVLEFDGFFGSITQIVAAWVALFLLYAGLLRGYGAFQLIMRLAFNAAKYFKSGVAQSAVLSSLIVGSINGAQTANAAMTGSFTIPLMKSNGMKSETAGGIEAVASSGGQIMPPVMGAAAFVMASLLGITYTEVLIAGIIPAVVFYVSVAIGVHYMSSKQLDEGEAQLESRLEDLDAGYHPVVEAVRFGVPFAILLYLLGVAQWTVVSSALYTCVTMVATGAGIPILLSAVRSEADVVATVKKQVLDTVEGVKYGATTLAPIAIIIAAVNGIVDLLNATGVPGKLSLALISVAGGVMLITIILAMVICLVLGLGMPTVAAYTIVALLIAPTLTSQFGVSDLAAHFFVFYSAILSGITPPIAIAVVVTTGIAGSNFWRTSLEALKLAAPLFILPFAFIYNPEIVTGGLTLYTIWSGLLVLLGSVLVIHGLNFDRSRLPSRAVSLTARAAFVVFGVAAMAISTRTVRLAALALGGALFLVQTRVLATDPTEVTN
ncbi:TRAP transporter permease [Halocalculus aciditolerans]|uniref:C4-dicarboxylate ABC transporter n=1 Tax=Halocalculus aciditolerans TaxID=1383812 RepID=A0A830FMJ2_9EURY|nr:TRAP transporter fused permease subunit [Halocalculus aciditolerans]GGL67379.1 C4-dicarboxylate ABC transporter [Halocalculus aciditolerans]